ncbi:hypothetical protein Dimus_032392 [Dionaea muscipula]
MTRVTTLALTGRVAPAPIPPPSAPTRALKARQVPSPIVMQVMRSRSSDSDDLGDDYGDSGPQNSDDTGDHSSSDGSGGSGSNSPTFGTHPSSKSTSGSLFGVDA